MLYRVVTCLPCGYREAVRPGAAYPPRCPNDGGPLEHLDINLSKQEARTLASRGRDTRRPRQTVQVPV